MMKRSEIKQLEKLLLLYLRMRRGLLQKKKHRKISDLLNWNFQIEKRDVLFGTDPCDDSADLQGCWVLRIWRGCIPSHHRDSKIPGKTHLEMWTRK